ncbi:MAG: hypothetical protein ABIQ93_15900 [Saprospiraceae bacterium]
MITLLAGTALLSVFHALIPSHWLPVVAVGKKQQWTVRQTLLITLLAGSAHVLSTALLGGIFAALGGVLADRAEGFTHWFAPVLLSGMGLFYIYQHYYHHHFHLHQQGTHWGIVASLALAMFLSPCLEIEGFFLVAGPYGWGFVALLAAVYGVVTVSGMVLWVWLALHGLHRLNWHRWEHNAGIITGLTLIVCGVLMLFLR